MSCSVDSEDIEDLFKKLGKSSEPDEAPRKKLDVGVRTKAPKKKTVPNPEDDEGEEFDQDLIQNIPGKEKVYVKTFGCSHNMSDSEFMIGQLAEYGYNITSNPDEADLILINSCTVKNPSQDAFMTMVNGAKNVKKPLVVAGCVPQGEMNLAGIEDVSVIGVTQIDRVVEVVEETLRGNKVRLLAKKDLPSLDLPKIRKNKFIEIIPINTGCLGSCTYCKTRHARGKLGSYDPQAILKRMISVADEGVKEIWLTSEDTGAYGRDIGTDISELLRLLVKNISDSLMLRIGMTNPPFILEHLETVAHVLNHPRVFSFLHIPVQSGSNSVLAKMNREYTIEEFCKVADYLLEHCPGITLATDIICGFPDETDEDFEQTLELVRKYKFPVLNISQFYPRPGTPAAKMKRVDTKIVKERSKAITKLFESYRCYDKLVGTVQKVWIADKEPNKHEGGMILVGHTKAYVKVVLPFDEALLGKSVRVKITEAHKWHITGDIVDRNPSVEHVSEDYFESKSNGGAQTKANSEESEEEATLNIHSKKAAKTEFKQTSTNPTQLNANISSSNATVISNILMILASILMAIGIYLVLNNQT